MRYTLLIYTNEADRPAWGTPEGDAEAKAYEAFHSEITRRGLQSGEPLLRVAEAESVRVRDGKMQAPTARRSNAQPGSQQPAPWPAARRAVQRTLSA